ncbi:MAG TPA: PaaI family thioesterase [Chitinispirillaceae bacterium]|nr:PaaI family thioesterase [Chitinispirillaceae bacterium]
MERLSEGGGADQYQERLDTFKATFNRTVAFHNSTAFPQLRTWFTDDGRFHGEFTCQDIHQGFEGIVHGGVLGSIIDTVMARCLMGHGFLCMTTTLNLRYHQPVRTDSLCTFSTWIKSFKIGSIYQLSCTIKQKELLCTSASGNFIKVKKQSRNTAAA